MGESNPFPLLNAHNHRLTSPDVPHYNCIAWAAGEDDTWWWPDKAQQAFWPHEAPRAETIEAFVKAYATKGYARCENGDLESGFEKIAIYARNGTPTHAARQLSNGRWTSKLGKSHDIEHELGGVEGPVYGVVALFMKRRGIPQAPMPTLAPVRPTPKPGTRFGLMPPAKPRRF